MWLSAGLAELDVRRDRFDVLDDLFFPERAAEVIALDVVALLVQ